jgi:hypothetical protein
MASFYKVYKSPQNTDPPGPYLESPQVLIFFRIYKFATGAGVYRPYPGAGVNRPYLGAGVNRPYLGA